MTPPNPLYIQFAVSLTTAVVTAVLTVWLSLNRFYREKWWEARMAAYSDLIKALHHIKNHSKNMVDRVYDQRLQDETDYQRGLTAKQRQAWDELYQYADLGEFVIAPAALRVLTTLRLETASEEDEDPVEYYEKCDIAIG